MKNRNRRNKIQRRTLQIESLERREYMDASGLPIDHFLPDQLEHLLPDDVTVVALAITSNAGGRTDSGAKSTNDSVRETQTWVSDSLRDDSMLRANGAVALTVQSYNFVISLIYVPNRPVNPSGRPAGLPKSPDFSPPNNADIFKNPSLPHVPAINDGGSSIQVRPNAGVSPFRPNQSTAPGNPFSLIAMNSASSVAKSTMEALLPASNNTVTKSTLSSVLGAQSQVQTVGMRSLLDVLEKSSTHSASVEALNKYLDELKETHPDSMETNEIKFPKRQSIEPTDESSDSPAVQQSDGLIALSAPMELLPTLMQQSKVKLPSAEFTWTQRIAMSDTGRSFKQDYKSRSNSDAPVEMAQSAEDAQGELGVKSVVPLAMSFVMIAWYQRHKRQHPIQETFRLLWLKFLRFLDGIAV